MDVTGDGCMVATLSNRSDPRAVTLDQRLQDFSQLGDDPFFEPRVLAHPNCAAPTGMWQREELRTVLRKVPDGLRHRQLRPWTQVISLGVLTHQERELDVGQELEEARVPARSTFRARWPVASRCICARITKAHGQNCESCLIIKSRPIQPEPVAQTVPACIVPGNSRLVDLSSRRLADDQHLCGTRQL